jgi:hypothetical protein
MGGPPGITNKVAAPFFALCGEWELRMPAVTAPATRQEAKASLTKASRAARRVLWQFRISHANLPVASLSSL